MLFKIYNRVFIRFENDNCMIYVSSVHAKVVIRDKALYDSLRATF